MHTSQRQRQRQATIFRICSTFNATDLAQEVSERRLARHRRRSRVKEWAEVPDAVVGVPQDRRIDRHGTPNR